MMQHIRVNFSVLVLGAFVLGKVASSSASKDDSAVCESSADQATQSQTLIQVRSLSGSTKKTKKTQLACPLGTQQVGGINADIAGCGLTPCDQRYALQTVEECKVMCTGNPRCIGFNWAPVGGDKNHMGETVCTVYDYDQPNRMWGPNQILCSLNKVQLACPPGTQQAGSSNADIGGCGLTGCNQRYAEQSIEECKEACAGHPQCKGFTWAPLRGDRNHMDQNVCTLYGQGQPTSTWGPNQIFCSQPTSQPTPTLGNLIVSDEGNNRVQSCPPDGGECTTLLNIEKPRQMLVTDDFYFVTSWDKQNGIKRCPKTGGACSLLGNRVFRTAWGATLSQDGQDVLACDDEDLWRCPVSGGSCSVAVSKFDNPLPAIDKDGKSHGTFTKFAAWDVKVASDGDYVALDNRYGGRIYRCTASDCRIVAGIMGEGNRADQFKYPTALEIDANGDYIVTDTFNHRVQKCPKDGGGPCLTVAGTGTEGNGNTELSQPRGMAIAPDGDYLIADMGNDRIQKCPKDVAGPCTTLSGGNGRGHSNDKFYNPWDVVF